MESLFLALAAMSVLLFWVGFGTRGFRRWREVTWKQVAWGLVSSLLWGVVWFYLVYLGMIAGPLLWLNYPLATVWGLLSIWLWGRGEPWGPGLYVFSLGAIAAIGFSGGLLVGRIFYWLLFGGTLWLTWRRPRRLGDARDARP